MGSIITAGECPNCGKTATFDDYYHTGELFVYCWHCGLYYTKITAPFDTYEEIQIGGFGVFLRVDDRGCRHVTCLNENMSVEEFEELAKLFNAEDTDTSKSYLVTYQDSQFICLLGELPEDFLLPYKEFSEESKEEKRVLHYLWG
jgi:ribosomal protein S27E